MAISMNQHFDTIIDSYLDNQVGISELFLDEQLASDLRCNLAALYAGDLLKKAGTGNEEIAFVDKSIRGDSIYWLDRSHNDMVENQFLDQVDRFVEYLNATCYAGIKSYEFHYARYDVGRFYKRHLDKFKSDDSRQFSVIVYLNENWISGHGGEPMNGKLVFFKSSDLEHEVLITNEPRLSITGWLKK
jgi:SM-20-related protein